MKKILIAEDDENSRKLLEAVLVAGGYTVFTFENGLKALAFLQQEPVDLIISDILMPEMDGYGLCRAVKQIHELDKIPFVFYTATYTSSQDERFAKSLGASLFLIKPMLMPDLLTKIGALIHSEAQVSSPKNRGLYRTTPLKLDKLHTERVREKLDKKQYDLVVEREKLIESEARFRDFAEASADWFWESDASHNISLITGGPKTLSVCNLVKLAESCYNQTSNEMLKLLELHQRFANFVIEYISESDPPVYLRVSGKPVFNQSKAFVGYRGVGTDVTETILLNRRIEHLAAHDELTGLPNRSLFRQRLEHAVAKAERSHKQLLVMFFDLDHFKTVNDMLGHDAGDQLLKLASKRIKDNVRATDILCRLGGDEFVMVMEGASPQDGHRLVRDIIASFVSPFEIDSQLVYSTVSIGVSVYPNDTADPQTLVLYADLAMYRAKQSGRNNFEFYTSDLNFIAHQWVDMEEGLRHALRENQFFILYQPQLDQTADAQMVGMEALLRWRHPERGLIPPTEFIKIAEQSSIINQIGDWVIETVCHQIRDWLDKSYVVPRVSVNISARHLRSDLFSKTLTSAIQKYQINPNLLCIEITEHTLIEDINNVKMNMQLIKEAGLQISLDDFGMGHSSLFYLKRWAIDELKIDHSFIEGIAVNEDDSNVVKAIVALGKTLGLNLVAEGVETKEQADKLIEIGCHQVQGFYFAAGLTSKELEVWLKKAKK
jgi:diguanylate cyclase (GGDEF)-like protein